MTKESEALSAFLSACIDGGMNGDNMKQAMAEYVKPPAWHDAPTCAGLWAPPCGAVLNVGQTNLEYWKQVTTQPCWFGPIPEDKP